MTPEPRKRGTRPQLNVISKLKLDEPIHHSRDEICTVLHRISDRDELLCRLQLYHKERAA